MTAELVQGLETIMSSNSQSHNKTRTELFSPSCITFALSDNHTPSAAQVPVPAVRDCCLAAPAEAFHHAAQVAQPLALVCAAVYTPHTGPSPPLHSQTQTLILAVG